MVLLESASFFGHSRSIRPRAASSQRTGSARVGAGAFRDHIKRRAAPPCGAPAVGAGPRNDGSEGVESARCFLEVYATEGDHVPESLSALESRCAELLRALANLDDMRPGSIVGAVWRCGKPTCHCAQPGDPGHGPTFRRRQESRGRASFAAAGAPRSRTSTTTDGRICSWRRDT